MKLRLLGPATEWKDRMAGWHYWQITDHKCPKCGRVGEFYFHGQKEDANKFKDFQCDICEKEEN